MGHLGGARLWLAQYSLESGFHFAGMSCCREHGFDESEPFGAVAAECDFALYNGFAERSFGGIIRGMYALGAKECPKRRPETDEVM